MNDEFERQQLELDMFWLVLTCGMLLPWILDRQLSVNIQSSMRG